MPVSINGSTGITGAINIQAAGSVLTGVTTITDNSTTGLVISGIATVSAGSTSAPSIAPSGDTNTGLFFPSADTIAFTSGGTERGRWISGGGLTFNGDTAAANALDDYEEGTWSPVVIGTSTVGTATYGQQHGVYTKIGRLVQFSMYLDWSSGTGAGNLRLSGLPFTSSSSSAQSGCSIGFFYSLTFAASHFLIANVGSNATYIEIRQGPIGGTNDSAVTYDSNAGIQISGAYIV
jgi:hypothetical protein